jgi:hypothetical protein
MLEVGTLVTPDTILRWHRLLLAQKWNHADKRHIAGRPATSPQIVELILQMAKENPGWGYDRIADALGNVGHVVSDQTVGNVLKSHGIEPAPERKRTTTWAAFLKAHWEQLAAVDFTTVEVWTTKGLVTLYLLFAMRLATRRVEFLGCTPHPAAPWMAQMARNLTDPFGGFLTAGWSPGFSRSGGAGARGGLPSSTGGTPVAPDHGPSAAPVTHVLIDRDTKFTAEFQAILKDAGAQPVLLPPRSPNCNAHLERFFRSLKDEALFRMIFFGENALRNAVREYLAHFHGERNHQGLDHKIIDPGGEVGQTAGEIACRERLGGLLNYYHRRAA